jgi:RecB family nuclease, putative, TM0106 family
MTLRALQSIQRQARSLVDQSVIIKKPWMHETTGMEIHFDIESHPMTDTDYLYGFWIRDEAHPEGKSVFFLADAPEEEEKMWKEFMAWLPTLPAEYTVYHYHSYEATRIQVIAKRYGDEESPWLERFSSRLVDLKEAAREHAVYPLYFYSLKNICTFLGFSWTSEIKSGGASIGAYERWLSEHDRSVLEDLVLYNRDDARATAHLLAWLNQYARQEAVYTKPYPWESAV